MEGLATRDDAKEAVDSIVATKIRVGMAEVNRGQSLKLKVCTSDVFGMFWQVNALRNGDVTKRSAKSTSGSAKPRPHAASKTQH